MKSRRLHGLTMVELTVVIAVTAILAAILFPVFAQAREAARTSSCRSNLHQIGLALHVYARDYDGRFPPGAYLTPLLGTYIAIPTGFRCPSESSAFQVGKTQLNNLSAISWVNGRPVVPPGDLYCSYAYRGDLTLDSPSATSVAGDWAFRHRERALVLNLAGEVSTVSAEQWVPFAEAPALPKALAGEESVVTPFLKRKSGKSGGTRPELVPAPGAPSMPGSLSMPPMGNGP